MTGENMPVRTFGLTHVALNVVDPERSFRFYEQLLGARTLGRLAGRENEDLSVEDAIEFGTPGAHDVIVLMRAKTEVTGGTGDLAHIGFRLVSEEDPDGLAAAVEHAGGSVLERGRFKSGEPYVFARDPDGYEIELWFQADPAPKWKHPR